ncbi:DUF397 domain-containing protein [Nocardia uniformis]|uniref:DUF397 domain-containing protein n=1 Tax=Nocardia uniformis TaxID=53432 RepID=A0A849CEY3_9NOCA|nr:DUF397 domain-containing protein [Nocardia uniformis]NNH71881.1 DUF397 domain-containing protein [Nocardia uniformis]
MRVAWFKSTFSSAEKTCVEVAFRDDVVLIRDSKYAGRVQCQPIISVSNGQWSGVLELVLSGAAGRVDQVLTVGLGDDGSAALVDSHGTELLFNAAEWDAFAKGVANGQFDRP